MRVLDADEAGVVGVMAETLDDMVKTGAVGVMVWCVVYEGRNQRFFRGTELCLRGD
jgi:hypothetical protein